ncbi:MAG: GSCFA domain-containing protein [Stenotrophobium sp.]
MAAMFSTVLAKIGLSRKPINALAAEEMMLRQIQAAYRCLLNRDSEPEGQTYWSTFMREGRSYEELLLNFVRSAEFQHRMDVSVQPDDPTADANQVRAAYICILGREAEPSGLAHWTDYLSEDGSYDRLLQSFIRSAEFQRRLAASSQLAMPAVTQHLITAENPPAEILRGKFAVLGNHQASQMAHCIQALTGDEMPIWQWVNADQWLDTESARASLLELFRTHDRVFMQPRLWDAVEKLYPELRNRVVLFPEISFSAFHPDIVTIQLKSTGANVQGPCGDYHSCLAFLGWKAGLNVAETHTLYKNENYQRLGFFHYWQGSATHLIAAGKEADLELAVFLDEWVARSCFMHSIHNPKLFVIADIARTLLQRNNIVTIAGNPCEYAQDPLASNVVWPVYPEIAEKLHIEDNYTNLDWVEHNYTFKLEASPSLVNQPVLTLNLKEFLEQSFEVYSKYAADDLICDRIHCAGYPELLADLQAQTTTPVSVQSVGLLPLPESPPDRTMHKHKWDAGHFAVLGNCQTGHMARCLQALVGGKMPKQEWVTTEMLAEWESGTTSLAPLFARHEKIFIQPWIWAPLVKRYAAYKNQVVLYPSIGFMASHPDLVPVVIKRTGTAFEDGPAMRCNSSLIFLGWKAGLSAQETARLFRRDIYQGLGFFDFWKSSAAALLEEGQTAGLPLDDLLAQWSRQGCFMHCHVHPKLSAIADIAKLLLKRLNIPMIPGDPVEFTHDYLANGIVWPVYPEVGEVLGCAGSYAFKLGSLYYSPDTPVHILGLEEFIERSFAAYSKYSPDELTCPRLESDGYRALLNQLQNSKEILVPAVEAAPVSQARVSSSSTHSGKDHPYRDLPPERFWRRAIENVRAEQVDPVIRTKFKITPVTCIATAGSCFAQRISERLGDRGFNFLQAETPPADMAASEAARLNYGAFSARFGFLYTARQLRQLIERAYGDFTPANSVWQLENGRFVDPFRPRVEPDGFRSVEELESSRTQHLSAVRRMFETLDVFIFTLGLTESWRDKTDGAVFPIAPGVAGGTMDFKRYEFVNFTVSEVDDDLQKFMILLSKINPAARVILTVSPVPLVATYADKHVLTSTMYSKSVLRVAADQIAQRHPNCDYFPSYEIIAGSFNRGQYFGNDLRAVTPAGVDHVMRLFFGHYAPTAGSESIDAGMLAEARKNISFLCDEELLAAASQ